MDAREVHCDFCLRLIREIQKLLRQQRIIEICPFASRSGIPNSYSRTRIQGIKLFQPIFPQQGENGLATETTKGFPGQGKSPAGTGFATMITPICRSYIRRLQGGWRRTRHESPAHPRETLKLQAHVAPGKNCWQHQATV